MSTIRVEKFDKTKHRIFVAADGSWGDADGLEVLDLTDEQLQHLNDLSESEQEDYLAGINDDQSVLILSQE